MKTKNVWMILGCVMAILMSSVSCGSKQPEPPPPGPKPLHAHGHAKCQPNPAVTTEIEIDSSVQVLVDPESEAILVCSGETLRWFTTDSAVASFTVDFGNKDNLGKLFHSGQEALQSEQGALSDPHYPHPHTKDQVVEVPPSSEAHHHLKDFIYSIRTKDGNNHLIHEIDPHIIPM